MFTKLAFLYIHCKHLNVSNSIIDYAFEGGLFSMNFKKISMLLLIVLLSSYTSYDYGYSIGYNDGYFDGSIEGHIINKYITHDYANFSAEKAAKEEALLKSMRGMNLSECDKILRNL